MTRPPVRMPPPLAHGARVRVVAPSSPFPRDRFEAGLAAIAAIGFTPVVADGLGDRRKGYLAGTDDARLAELIAALDDPDIGAIFCARGGFGATRLLPRYTAALNAHLAAGGTPRWLIGFSDITALHAAHLTAGIASIHGPVVSSLGDEPALVPLRLRDLLMGIVNPDEPLFTRLRCIGGPPASASTTTIEGVLVGGNLSLLAALCGTPSMPSLDGAIVLLEDVGEVPYRIDRMLTQLTQANAFAGARAIVFGHFTRCDAPGAPIGSAIDALIDRALELTSQLAIPICIGAPFGHEPPNLPWLHGATARLDLTRGTLAYLAPATATATA